MKPALFPVMALVAAFGGPVFADTTSPAYEVANAASSGADTSVPAAAKDAVATVERFSAALSSGDLAKAGMELDPDVLILESGGAEHSAAEYLGGHARDDAAFLKTAHQELLLRRAHASGDFAWVASESELHIQKDGRTLTVLSAETMVLRRGTSGWRIVHIHWSSRTKEPSTTH